MMAGEFRDLLDVERPVENTARGGGVSTRFARHVTGVPAKVEDLGGRALFEAASVRPQATVRVVVRHLHWLTTAYRFHDVARDRILNIGHIAEDARRRVMTCLCEVDRDAN